MAILFFDGFDRCTITKQLDRNYWSFQPQVPVEYEKYAFGGYSYDHTQNDYNNNNNYYAYSPNNGHLPTSKYVGATTIGGAATTYPAFGTPFGFLALNNLDISDSSLLAPLTYLQVSGFSLPQSGESFLNFRIHGIETKDSNYHSSDEAGRFGAKHPLVAFCSGNTTGLIFNIVKVTGNQLETVENTKMTIGLEVEQLAGVSGSFDLNIANDLADYNIRSLYSRGSASYHSGTAQAADLSDLGGRILMPVADRNTTSPYIPQSRWCHFTFGIIQTGVTPEIKVKLDNIDLLTIPTDDTITDKDLWDDKISISGFNYDNIRFFNRTYNASIPIAYTTYYSYGGNTTYSNHMEDVESNYYERGANTLLDDIILNDGSGTANTFLGKTAKIIPFTPGVRGQYTADVTDGGVVPDPYREWTTNTTSHRAALKNLDGDTGKISSATAGQMTAIPFGSGNIEGIQATDNWRREIQDAVGGMKIYTAAKKEFLDSSFVPVIKTGELDKFFANKTSILIRPSGGLIDALKKETISFSPVESIPALTPISKFGSGVDMHGSHFVVPFIESQDELFNGSAYDNSHLYQNSYNLVDDNRFVIESWVYFTGSEPIDLYSTFPPTGYEYGVPTRTQNINISCDPEGITYSMSNSGDTLTYVHTQNVKLLFNETAATEQWHHVVFVQDYVGAGESTDSAWPIYSFLNGVRNSKYVLSSSTRNWDTSLFPSFNFRYDIFPTSRTSGILGGDLYPSGDFNIDKNMLLNLSSPSGALVGSGTLNNPATGVITLGSSTSSFSEDLISFTVDDTGFLVLNMDAVLVNNYHTFEIYRNNIKQFTIGGSSEMIPVLGNQQSSSTTRESYQNKWAQIYVNSGDNIGIRRNPNTYTALSTVNIKQLYVASPTGIGPFYHYQQGGLKYDSFGRYSNRYVTDGGNFNNSKILPTFIGGNNIMGQYRLTQGSAQVQDGVTRTRYRDGFDIPTTGFFIDKESYIDLSENIDLTKTRYGKTREFFVFNNPETDQPWTTGLIADPSGLILGVRKT